MSTNQTENYHLSQWEATDPVLREDFNADNQKIEAAIAGRMGPLEIIQEKTLGQSKQGTIIDMTGFDWNSWSVVGALLLCQSEPSKNCTAYINLDGCPLSGSDSENRIGQRKVGPLMVLLFPHRDAARQPVAAFFPACGVGWGAGKTYSDITGLHFAFSGVDYPSTDTHLIFFGIR